VTAFSILMGCSSGNQYTEREFEPYGTILDYVLAGFLSVVGNLCDVTTEVFSFAEDLIKSLIQGTSNILKIVNLKNILLFIQLHANDKLIFFNR
jgi:hypothetical protein